MFPTLFSANGIELHTWGLMVVTAFLAASLVASVRAPRVGIEADKLVPMYLLVTFAGLVGARLLHFAMADDPPRGGIASAFFDMGQGGYVFYGGAIGGILSGALYAAARGIPVLKLADVTAPTILLGQAIGRLGCFLAGCCYGQPTELPWGVRFPAGGLPPSDVDLHPTQLYEFAATSLMIGLLLAWRRVRPIYGLGLPILGGLYGSWRIFNESLRGDGERGTVLDGLMTNGQMTSLILMGIAAAGEVALWRAGERRAAPTAG